MFREIEEFNRLFGTGIYNTTVNAKPSSAEIVLAEGESYLHRQDKIVSLAKEKFLTLSKKVAFTDLEQKLFDIRLAQNDSYKKLISQVARQVVRPLLATFTVEGDASYKMLIDMVPDNIKIRLTRKLYSAKEHACYLKRLRLSEGAPLIFIDIEEDGFHALQAFGATVAHGKAWKNVLFRDGKCMCDMGELFASFLLMKIVEKEYKRIRSLSDSEKSEDTIFQNLLQIEGHWEKLLSRYKCVFISRISEKDFPERYIDMLRNQLSCRILVYNDVTSARRTAKECGYQQEDYLILNSSNIQHVYAAFGSRLGRFVYHDFLQRYGDDYWPVPKTWDIGAYLADAYRIIHQVRSEQNAFLRKIEGELKAHSKSYQNKRNIPLKVLGAMERSLLNKRFGFIEYDESCDFTKVVEVEKEILAFLNRYTPFVDATNNQIRFRKLGNHKATGLYYPCMKCLCVDMRHVYSFIHEFGHLIDYEYGNLSDKHSFSQVRSAYRDYLAKCNLSGLRGKYDINYYLMPTEIFARSFEIYVSKVLGVKNSLLPDSFSAVYPIEDDTYMCAIKNYFDGFFLNCGVKKAS